MIIGIAEEFRLEVVRSKSVAVAAETSDMEDTLSNGWSDLPVAAVADVLSHNRLVLIFFILSIQTPHFFSLTPSLIHSPTHPPTHYLSI